MPEAGIILAHATIHAALAPKSNAVVVGLGAATADVRAGGIGRVPPHLRDGHYPGAAALGHGRGYVYPHDVPGGVAEQQYLPDELLGRRYYRPSGHGAEAAWGDVAARDCRQLRSRRRPLGLVTMRRIVWVAIGAAGGIVAYRRAQQAVVDARERGVVLSAQQVGHVGGGGREHRPRPRRDGGRLDARPREPARVRPPPACSRRSDVRPAAPNEEST